MRRCAPLLLAALLLCSGGLRALSGGPPAAVADEGKEARKAFREALKTESWRERREAYLGIADYDGGEVAKEVLAAMAREPNPAVILTAIGVLAGFRSKEARETLVAELRKSKGTRKTYILLALARQPGKEAVPILLETVQGKDEQAAAQAALALGHKEVEEAVPHLVALLRHKSWQLRRAGAMGLANIAQPPPPKPKADGTKPPPDFRWPVPHFMLTPEVTQALVASLGLSKGRERGDIITALEEIHDARYGYNLAAWTKVAAGAEPDEKDLAKRVYPPHVFKIPIYGRRVVLMLDNGLRSGDPHRFGSEDRMAALCEVPGSDLAIFSARLRTVGEFTRAHFRRCIEDMRKGTQFEVIVYNEFVRPVFGKFMKVGGASKRLVDETFAGLETDNAGAVYGAFLHALDMGGATEKAAWKKGPDEIVFTSCSLPTVGQIKDGDVIAAAIALKARLRMVPIHTIGLERHPYAMIDPIAKETGGIYRNYYE